MSSEPAGPSNAIPETPILEYFKQPLFQGPKGDQLAARLKEAHELINDPTPLVHRFVESVQTFEGGYSNYQPFHPRGHSFASAHGLHLGGGVDVAAALRKSDGVSDPHVWTVGNDRQLDFVYIDREIELPRTKPGPKIPGGATLIADLFLANAHDRTPILCEVKVRTDQCPFYALIQLLCQATYAATRSQMERLILFGSRDNFVLQEAPAGGRLPLDLYVLLAEPSEAQIYVDLRNAAVELGTRLVTHPAVADRIGRLAWLVLPQDTWPEMELVALSNATSVCRSPRRTTVTTQLPKASEAVTSRQFIDVDLPSRFILECLTPDGSWSEWGMYEANAFDRGLDGTYLYSGVGSPVYIRCLRQDGSVVYAADGAGDPYTYRLVAVP